MVLDVVRGDLDTLSLDLELPLGSSQGMKHDTKP